MKRIFTLVFAFAFAQLAAQTPSGIKEIAFADLPSASGQAYRIFISLPDDYGQTGKRYPVLYILDADFNFLHLANLARQLADSNQFEPSILIGIGYGTTFLESGNNRYRDFSPSPLAKYPGSGRAEAFRGFLSDRLKPFVDGHYRTNGQTTIHGHSMGGLFLTYILFTKPDLFDRYLITSPSLWWDQGKVFAYEAQYHTQHQGLKAKVFLSVAGKEGKVMEKNWNRLKKTLETRNYTELEWKTRYYPDQTHIGVIPGAVKEGLLYLHQSE